MDITEKTKAELESRIKELEGFINDRGLGSRYLKRAKAAQRNINLALFFGGVLTLAGLIAWVVSDSEDDEA